MIDFEYITIPSFTESVLFVNTNNSNSLIDAAGEKFGYVLEIPKTGQIAKMAFRTGQILMPAPLRITLQNLDSNGFPNNTLYSNSQPIILNNPSTNTFYELNFPNLVNATRGNRVGLVFEFQSTVGVVNFTTFVFSGFSAGFPYSVHFTTGWFKRNFPPFCSLIYNDETLGGVNFMWCFKNLLFYQFNTSSSPNEYGVRFILPVGVRARGIYFRSDTGTNGSFNLNLYFENSLVRQIANFPGTLTSEASNRIHFHLFDEPIDIPPDTLVRVTMTPTSTTNTSISYFEVQDVKYWESFSLGSGAYQIARTGSGSWTENFLRRPIIGLIINGIQRGGVSSIAYF